MKHNTSGPRAEGVVCQLPGDNDAFNIMKARVQRLARLGLAPTRAELLATLVFGEVMA